MVMTLALLMYILSAPVAINTLLCFLMKHCGKTDNKMYKEYTNFGVASSLLVLILLSLLAIIQQELIMNNLEPFRTAITIVGSVIIIVYMLINEHSYKTIFATSVILLMGILNIQIFF